MFAFKSRSALQTLRSLLPWLGCVFLLACVTALVFWRHLTGKTFFTFDFPMAYYAMTAYWISSVQAGEWPQWIPYQSMGYPALMNPQLGMFYPPFWLFVILRVPYTMHAAIVVQVAHILFGGVGFVMLASRVFHSRMVGLCGGVAFLFFGGFYTNAEHPDIVRTFAWIPWLLWATLLNQETACIAIGGKRTETRLSRRTVALPFLVSCFITGSYPGGMIAGLFLLFVFIGVQSILLFRESQHRRMILCDSTGQAILVMLGIAIASVFLIPTFHLTRDITRAAGFGAMQTFILTWRTFNFLIFPSSLLTTSDYSMHGMQCPATLVLFCGLLSRSGLRKIAPFLVLALIASLMCVQTFRPVAAVLIRVCPFFGLSRFPAGDYREFIYLALLLTALAGVSEALSAPRSWRTIAIMLVGQVSICVLALHAGQQIENQSAISPFLHFSTRATELGLLTIVIVGLGMVSYRFANLLGYALPVLICLSMLPVILSMKVFWDDPNIINYLYDSRGVYLKDHGQLRAKELFQRAVTARSARITSSNPYNLSWRGYIDGAYMTDDLGGTRSFGRAAVESRPELLSFMRQPSSVVGVNCTAESKACGATPGFLNVVSLPSVGHVLWYRRNDIEYDIQLTNLSLAIENEIYTDGWHGECETHHKSLQCERIDGGLRGWVLPAGSHHVRVWYETPLLFVGALLSAAALVVWLAVLVIFARFVKHDVPTEAPPTVVAA